MIGHHMLWRGGRWPLVSSTLPTCHRPDLTQLNSKKAKEEKKGARVSKAIW